MCYCVIWLLLDWLSASIVWCCFGSCIDQRLLCFSYHKSKECCALYFFVEIKCFAFLDFHHIYAILLTYLRHVFISIKIILMWRRFYLLPTFSITIDYRQMSELIPLRAISFFSYQNHFSVNFLQSYIILHKSIIFLVSLFWYLPPFPHICLVSVVFSFK